MAGHALRLAQDGHQIAVEERNGVAMIFVGRAAVVLEIARGRRDVGTRLFQRLAAIARLELGQFFVVGEDGLAEPGHQAATFDSRRFPPGAFLKGMTSGLDRRIDIRLGAARDTGEGLAVAWAQHGDGATIGSSLPFSPDQILEYRDCLPCGRPGFHDAAHAPPSLADYCLSGRSVSSTRRFNARPDSVSLLATGRVSPAPTVMVRSCLMPLPIRDCATAVARRSDNV